MRELWNHVDRDGDKGTLSRANENELRLWSTRGGSDLDRDAAERLITALAEHFRIPQLVICGEPKPDESTVCARWPGHDGQHAGRGDRSNTHPTWVVWGGGGPKNRPTCGGGVLGQCDQIPGHDGRHNTPVCGEGFTHLGQQETCDVVAGHIGGHQRIGLRTDPQPEPEVSVQDLLKDAFRQRSRLHTGMLQQHTATHEMLAEQLGMIGDRTRATSHELGDIAKLLTEIRDRMPETQQRCGFTHDPFGDDRCQRSAGHTGNHDSAAQA